MCCKDGENGVGVMECGERGGGLPLMKMLGTVLWPVSSTIEQKKGLRLKHVTVDTVWTSLSSLHTCQSSLDRGAMWVDVKLDYFEGNIFILEKRLSPLAEWTIAIGNDTVTFFKENYIDR